MIAFKDFAPAMTSPGGLFSKRAFQSLQKTVELASRWCEKNQVVPLNVETVVLPDIHHKGQEGSADVHLTTTNIVEWHQVVRVWYLSK